MGRAGSGGLRMAACDGTEPFRKAKNHSGHELTVVSVWKTSRTAKPQCAAGARPPSLTLRRLIASGTAASEISVSTQKTSM